MTDSAPVVPLRLRPRDRDAIVSSLRAGVVPQRGFAHIQVGRANEIAAFAHDIDRVADGGSMIRFVIGDYSFYAAFTSPEEYRLLMSGRPPRFAGGHGGVHDQVRARMRSVLAAGPVPRYLSAAAVSLLSEARAAYARNKLAEHMTVRDGADTVLFPGAGPRAAEGGGRSRARRPGVARAPGREQEIRQVRRLDRRRPAVCRLRLPCP